MNQSEMLQQLRRAVRLLEGRGGGDKVAGELRSWIGIWEKTPWPSARWTIRLDPAVEQHLRAVLREAAHFAGGRVSVTDAGASAGPRTAI